MTTVRENLKATAQAMAANGHTADVCMAGSRAVSALKLETPSSKERRRMLRKFGTDYGQYVGTVSGIAVFAEVRRRPFHPHHRRKTMAGK